MQSAITAVSGDNNLEQQRTVLTELTSNEEDILVWNFGFLSHDWYFSVSKVLLFGKKLLLYLQEKPQTEDFSHFAGLTWRVSNERPRSKIIRLNRLNYYYYDIIPEINNYVGTITGQLLLWYDYSQIKKVWRLYNYIIFELSFPVIFNFCIQFLLTLIISYGRQINPYINDHEF